MEKKRELLTHLNKCILALTSMSADAANLEIIDNDQASRRLRRDVLHFKSNELEAFFQAVRDTREQVRNRPKRKTQHNPIENLYINQQKTNT